MSSSKEMIADAVRDYLVDQQALDSTKAKAGRDIVEYLSHKMNAGDFDRTLAKTTIWQYLNDAATHNQESPVKSTGNKTGYFVEIAQDEGGDGADDANTDKNSDEFNALEKHLYPLFEFWLRTKGFATADVANLKKGGKWGNPDILGAQRTEAFGAVELEIASCEVKNSDKNWQLEIFEAISHKRFSHRSWYCMRVSDESVPIPKGIEYYAERYRVGIVRVVLTDNEVKELKENPQMADMVVDKIEEVFPALYDFVPLSEIKEVLDRSKFGLGLAKT